MLILRLVFAMIVVVLILPAKSQEVSPYDYRVPESSAEVLFLEGSYVYRGSGSEVTRHHGRASMEYERFYSSLPYSWDFELNGSGGFVNNPRDEYEGTYRYVARPGIRKYLNTEGRLFYSGELDIDGNHNDSRPSIRVTPGLRYGRFIHISPLARAARIDQFLLEEGVISRPLPKETLIALA